MVKSGSVSAEIGEQDTDEAADEAVVVNESEVKADPTPESSEQVAEQVVPAAPPMPKWPETGAQRLPFDGRLHNAGTRARKGICGWHGNCGKAPVESLRIQYASGVSAWSACPEGVKQAEDNLLIVGYVPPVVEVEAEVTKEVVEATA
jgi:hypothetical protein